ncbi:MAG: hypothetical protein IKJ43_03035 [Bacilli bacterium]|nr:hypothetical protein [Bacilli bacterium]
MIDEKILLISHIADEDGLTPVILANLVYKEVDTILLNPGEVDEKLRENIDKYNLIYITDLSITEDLAKEIEANEEYKNKIKLFDHHATALPLNKYSFAKVVVEESGYKQSGTSLFHKYLLTISDNEILKKDSTKGLVEEVRKIDTYDFKTEEDKEALNLDYLFAILGRENYIDYFTDYIKNNDSFEYNEREKLLIKLQKDKIDNYITQKEKEVILAKVDGHDVAIVYAESNRSLLGNYLVEKLDIDFAIIINVSRGISYRGKDKVDLSVFAKKYNGGGHKNASGSPLPEDTLKILTKRLFKEVEFKGGEENE